MDFGKSKEGILVADIVFLLCKQLHLFADKESVLLERFV